MGTKGSTFETFTLTNAGPNSFSGDKVRSGLRVTCDEKTLVVTWCFHNVFFYCEANWRLCCTLVKTLEISRSRKKEQKVKAALKTVRFLSLCLHMLSRSLLLQLPFPPFVLLLFGMNLLFLLLRKPNAVVQWAVLGGIAANASAFSLRPLVCPSVLVYLKVCRLGGKLEWPVPNHGIFDVTEISVFLFADVFKDRWHFSGLIVLSGLDVAMDRFGIVVVVEIIA